MYQRFLFSVLISVSFLFVAQLQGWRNKIAVALNRVQTLGGEMRVNNIIKWRDLGGKGVGVWLGTEPSPAEGSKPDTCL